MLTTMICVCRPVDDDVTYPKWKERNKKLRV